MDAVEEFESYNAIKLNIETIRSLAYEISGNSAVAMTEKYIHSVGTRIMALANELEQQVEHRDSEFAKMVNEIEEHLDSTFNQINSQIDNLGSEIDKMIESAG